MGLIFPSFAYDLIFVIFSILFLIYISFKYSYTYWSSKKVTQITPKFPFGNLLNFVLQKRSYGLLLQDMYNEFRSKNIPFGGYYAFNRPYLIICDPELIKTVLTKDFHNFTDRDNYVDEENDPLTTHLIALRGEKWKQLRSKLSPAFTSGSLKSMFHFFTQCSNQLTEQVNKFVEKSEPIDIKELFARFTTDIIGNCAFGIDCNSFANPDAEFTKYRIKISTGILRLTIINMLSNVLNARLLKLLKLKTFGDDVTIFFRNLVHEIIEYRETNNIRRNDIMNMLIKLKNNDNMINKNLDKGLSIDEITAQAFIFFAAAFETSSSTMTFCLYELASNPNIQEKVRQDIQETLKNHNNELTYEAIMSMNYLDKVVKETLRKYPIITANNRKCLKNYRIPNTDIIIEKGITVHISTIGLHHDPQYYPNPLKFDPERFSQENKCKRHSYTYLPFGEGPRICIGARFGLLQIKIGIASLLTKYKFSLDPRMKKEIEFDNKSTLLYSKDIVWLLGYKI